MNASHPARLPVSLILLLFFLSGALALTYQVVWARLMTHAFGSTALAIGTVLAAFMSGLALGSWLAGRLADRAQNGLRVYARLEIGIAATALLAHLLLHRFDDFYPALHGLLGGDPLAVGLARFVLAFTVVLAPTALMGATLPVLTRYLMRGTTLAGHRLSALYAANTLGAVAGVLLTGFWLIGRYGVHVPVYLAVTGNLMVGLAAWALSARGAKARGAPRSAAAHPAPAAQPPLDARTVRLVVIGLGLSGFTSFAYEVYWTRSLVFVLGNSTYALSTMLTAFLTGIALGGFAVRFLFDRAADGVVLFGTIQVLLGVSSALALPLLFLFVEPTGAGQVFLQTDAAPLSVTLAAFGVAALLMLVPATLIGATFPLAGHLGIRDPQRAGSTVGRIYAINTLGNVLGALLPGVVLLAWLGIQRGILAMAGLNIAIGFTLLLRRRWRSSWRWRLALPLLLIISLGLLGGAPLDFEFPSQGETPRHQTVFYREGPLATTKVFADPERDEKLMSVDGIVIGGTGTTEFKQLLLAHLPKLLLDQVETELSVGIGSGMLAGESLAHDRVARLVGVEIEPGVIQGASYFAAENHGVLQDPRLEIVVDDIGSFLRTTEHTYRVISADEKTADEYASNGFSYSREYYELLMDHLHPEGLAVQWVPTTLPPRQYRMVLKTFASVFPEVQLWYFLPAWQRGPFNTLLVGSHRPIPIEPTRMQARFDLQPDAWSSLERYGITSAESVLPHFIADGELLRTAVADAALNTLDHPRYEFYAPWDYARERAELIAENHRMLLELKRERFPDYLALLVAGGADNLRTRRSLAAEDRYLSAFEQFLKGMPLQETYDRFDDVLSIAPWNDSLRARVYAQYRYLAETRRDPVERQRLMRKADALYAAPVN